MVDLDTDGFPDLFVATGPVYPELEQKLPAYPFRSPRLVFRNLGDGRFEELLEEAGSGVSEAHSSRGCAFGDFDNDGDMDVLVMNMNEHRPWCAMTFRGLKVLLIGVTTNRSAIGTRVVARYGTRRQAQEVILCILPFWRHPNDGFVDVSGYAEVSVEHLHSADADAVSIQDRRRSPPC